MKALETARAQLDNWFGGKQKIRGQGVDRDLTKRTQSPPPINHEQQQANATHLTSRPPVDYSQLQSPLFQLPLEVRELIWEFCCCNLSLPFAIDASTGRLCLARHKSSDYEALIWREPGCLPLDYKALFARRLLSLPLSCRRMYSETIDLLYSLSRVMTMDNDVVQFFPTLLIPRHLHAIRRLDFTWRVTRPFRRIDDPYRHEILNGKWRLTWTSLAMMEGLEILDVQIHAPRGWVDGWRDIEVELLGETRHVTRPRRFDCQVNWSPSAEAEKLKELPCRVIHSYRWG